MSIPWCVHSTRHNVPPFFFENWAFFWWIPFDVWNWQRHPSSKQRMGRHASIASFSIRLTESLVPLIRLYFSLFRKYIHSKLDWAKNGRLECIVPKDIKDQRAATSACPVYICTEQLWPEITCVWLKWMTKRSKRWKCYYSLFNR